jgi:hypothetical protein
MAHDELHRLADGEIILTLHGWPGSGELRLVPSLAAALKITRKYSGFAGVLQRIANGDIDAYVDVIAAGADVTESGRDRLPEAVYKTGVMELLPPVTAFVLFLTNGGRSKPKNAEDEEKADPSPA